MINWQTILTSVLLSSTIVGLIVFLLKKTLEKGIETKFKEVENKQRINLEENKRREGKIFDDQYEICKSVIALTYRVRNGSRDIVDELSKNDYNLLFIDDRLKIQADYFRALRDLMLDNRAVLPELVFKELHDLSHSIDYFNSNLIRLSRQNKKLNSQQVQEIITETKAKFQKIDQHYLVMTGIVQSSLGVDRK